MSDSPWDDPGIKEWMEHCERELVPMIRDSAVSLTLLPKGKPDLKFAVELGLCIMLDKPIIAVVLPGVKVPSGLVKVADAIVEGDLKDLDVQRQLQEAIARVMGRVPDGQ